MATAAVAEEVVEEVPEEVCLLPKTVTLKLKQAMPKPQQPQQPTQRLSLLAPCTSTAVANPGGTVLSSF